MKNKFIKACTALSIGTLSLLGAGSSLTHAEERFVDVPQNHWSFTAIQDLKEKKIVIGYGNGIFGFGDNVTREQVAILMYNYLQPEDRGTYKNPYPDVNSQTTNYSKQILSLTALGVIKGDENGNYRPKDTLNRAEMAAILTRAFNLKIAGELTFKDVPKDHWAKDVITAVQTNNVADGTGYNEYSPSLNVTREQYAQFVYKAMNRNNKPGGNDGSTSLPVEDISGNKPGDSNVTDGGTIFK